MQNEAADRAALILKAVYEHVGGRVGLSFNLLAIVELSGIQHHGPVYDAAVQFLVEEVEALDEYERGGAVAAGDRPYGNLYYAMTQKGKEIVEGAGRRGDSGAPDPG